MRYTLVSVASAQVDLRTCLMCCQIAQIAKEGRPVRTIKNRVRSADVVCGSKKFDVAA